MGRNSKINKLRELRRKIINNYFSDEERQEDVWFFPPGRILSNRSYNVSDDYGKPPPSFLKNVDVESVKGYEGTGPIFFLCINPSTGKFDYAAKIFYMLLKCKNLDNAHVTDFFKTRMTGKQLIKAREDRDLIQESVRYLREELAIIQPKKIVVVGNNADFFKKHLGEYSEYSKVRKVPIVHYTRYKYIKMGERISFFRNLMKEVTT